MLSILLIIMAWNIVMPFWLSLSITIGCGLNILFSFMSFVSKDY